MRQVLSRTYLESMMGETPETKTSCDFDDHAIEAWRIGRDFAVSDWLLASINVRTDKGCCELSCLTFFDKNVSSKLTSSSRSCLNIKNASFLILEARETKHIEFFLIISDFDFLHL